MQQMQLSPYFQDYSKISEILQSQSYEETLQQAAALLNADSETLEQNSAEMCKNGRLSENYQTVLQDMVKNITQFDWLFDRLEDKISRQVFSNIVRFRLIPDRKFIANSLFSHTHQYFEKDLIRCSEREVFVDCGGHNGEDTLDFIRQYDTFRKIYVYEMVPSNAAACQENLKSYSGVDVRNCVAGEQNCEIEWSSLNSDNTSEDHGLPTPDSRIKVVSLDEDISEKITFIKMAMDGSEISALLGAKKHIRADKPKLAVCVDGVCSNLWVIPRLIHSINADYRFYLRCYGSEENWKTVLYAVPNEMQQEKKPVAQRREKNVLALAYNRGWYNKEMTKDRLCIPYLLHKNHHCNVKIIGERVSDTYSNAQYIPGCSIEFVDCWDDDAKMQYITRHALDYDLITMPEAQYGVYAPLVARYKQLNPEGKVYVSLDANGQWMDRTPQQDPLLIKFLNCCDVIGASCRAMQDYLNEKWPWKIEYFPNAFYDFTGKYRPPVFAEKENIILTVGRLGTVQKATEIMLEAFSRIAAEIPQWTLKLIGEVNADFRPWLEQFWKKHPELEDRIIFTGPILDREILYAEYRKAKVMLMTSRWEGAPNVTAEALFHGCATCYTRIDAYQDAVDHGRCGVSAQIDNIEDIAKQLLTLCRSEHLEEFCRHAYELGRTTYDMETNVARLYKMLFGEEERV